MEVLRSIAYIVTGVTLVLSGYSDYKTRKVSNLFPVIILLAGILTSSNWVDKGCGLILPLILALIALKITKQESGGADLKMYSAIGFNFGFSYFVWILIGSMILVMVVNRIKKRSAKETVPMCTYLSITGFIGSMYMIITNP